MPSNGINFTVINRQQWRLILTVKKISGISNLTISDEFHGILAPEESRNWKNEFTYSWKHSFESLRDHQLILIYTEVNMYLNCLDCLKFPLK